MGIGTEGKGYLTSFYGYWNGRERIFNVILWVLERKGNDIERHFVGIGTEWKGYLTSFYGYWNGRERILNVILWVLEGKGKNI